MKTTEAIPSVFCSGGRGNVFRPVLCGGVGGGGVRGHKWSCLGRSPFLPTQRWEQSAAGNYSKLGKAMQLEVSGG